MNIIQAAHPFCDGFVDRDGQMLYTNENGRKNDDLFDNVRKERVGSMYPKEQCPCKRDKFYGDYSFDGGTFFCVFTNLEKYFGSSNPTFSDTSRIE